MSGLSFLSYSLNNLLRISVTSVSCDLGAKTHFWFDGESSFSSSSTLLDRACKPENRQRRSSSFAAMALRERVRGLCRAWSLLAPAPTRLPRAAAPRVLRTGRDRCLLRAPRPRRSGSAGRTRAGVRPLSGAISTGKGGQQVAGHPPPAARAPHLPGRLGALRWGSCAPKRGGRSRLPRWCPPAAAGRSFPN